jgi:hypothetical protein
MNYKTHIKQKNLKQSTFKKKELTKKKDRRRKNKQRGGEVYNNPTTTSELSNNSEMIINDESNKQPEEVLEEATPQEEHALVGTYNDPEKNKKGSKLFENIERARGGLFLEYPPPINTTKEDSLMLKMKNKREEGFTDFKGNPEDQLEPKFLSNKFYPKYSIFYELVNNSQNQESTNTMNNMEGNVTSNNLSGNSNNIFDNILEKNNSSTRQTNV